MKTTHIDITVRAAYGTYLTNRVTKTQASNTCGPEQAAWRLGQKLFGASLDLVERLDTGDVTNVTNWRLHATEHCAWAWQSGLIEIGPKAPAGALQFAVGMEAPLRAVLSAVARHGQGKSEGKLIVPGVPEAKVGKAKVDALIDWQRQCARCNGSPNLQGVVFGAKPCGERLMSRACDAIRGL